jgi:hypothetical protein
MRTEPLLFPTAPHRGAHGKDEGVVVRANDEFTARIREPPPQPSRAHPQSERRASKLQNAKSRGTCATEPARHVLLRPAVGNPPSNRLTRTSAPVAHRLPVLARPRMSVTTSPDNLVSGSGPLAVVRDLTGEPVQHPREPESPPTPNAHTTLWPPPRARRRAR